MPSAVSPKAPVRVRLVPVLLIAAYTLLLGTWALSMPPAVAADELAHYIRAAGIARGQWVLPDPAPLPPDVRRSLNRGQVRARTQTGVVVLPESLSPKGLTCRSIPFSVVCPYSAPDDDPDPTRLETNMGTSQPFVYVIPGVGTLLSDRAVPALLWGRLAVAASSALLFAFAVLALWQGGRGALALTGLIASLTPMMLSVGASLSSSGPELAAGLCLFACLLRLARPQAPPGWLWVALSASGFLLAATRDLGPFFAAMQIFLFVALAGARPAWRRLRTRGGMMTAAVIGLGMVLNAIWQVTVEPHPPLSLTILRNNLDPGWENLREVGRHAIGVFGPLDTVLNPGAYFAWMVILISLMSLAYLVGTGRHRLLLTLSIVMSLGSTIALETVQRIAGFGPQGRQLLPIFVTMPLLAGEVVFLNRRRLAMIRPRLVLWFALGAASVQLLAWYIAGRRYAVGPTGDQLFYREPVFIPPLGWITWGAAAALACLILVLAGWLSPFEAASSGGSEDSPAPSP